VIAMMINIKSNMDKDLYYFHKKNIKFVFVLLKSKGGMDFTWRAENLIILPL